MWVRRAGSARCEDLRYVGEVNTERGVEGREDRSEMDGEPQE